MSSHKGMISIWFFIGIQLLAYGVLIFGAGIYDYNNPAAHPVVLAELHAGIWWGILLLLVGAWYTYKFAPRKN